MKHRRRTGPITLIVTGVLLCLGPVWGLLGTVVGMLNAFEHVAEEGEAATEALASDIGLALHTTAAGLIAVPFGIAALVCGIIWLIRLENKHATRKAVHT